MALQKAIARLQPDANKQAEQQRQLEDELNRIEQELGRLVSAIATGGDAPTLLKALRERERRQERLRIMLVSLSQSTEIGHLDAHRLEQQ